jgi:hypothetical protein
MNGRRLPAPLPTFPERNFALYFAAYFCIFMCRLNLHSILFFHMFSPYLLLFSQRYFAIYFALVFCIIFAVYFSALLPFPLAGLLFEAWLDCRTTPRL